MDIINNLAVIPSSLNKGFGFCIYGQLSDEISNFAKEMFLTVEVLSPYVNLYPTSDTDLTKFYKVKRFKYMDGFSPNLNKHLHIGHFSNLVLAKAFKGLGVAENYVAILGDTLTGDVDKADALFKFIGLCKLFEYELDEVNFASLMKCDESIFVDGADKYEGTKIIEVGDDKVVVIKNDGTTSYFYQDIALAQKLNADTLYLTGYEQNNHFETLKKIFPQVNHIGLGLVKLKNKMSSRLGNVIYITELMDELLLMFNGNEKLCYNIFAGYILKNNPTSDKFVDYETFTNPKKSMGLYLSYTLARLKSAGVEKTGSRLFTSKNIEVAYLMSQSKLNPRYLFDALVDLCKDINQLYITHHISGNDENKKMFAPMLTDLVLGMNKLGLFEIDKV